MSDSVTITDIGPIEQVTIPIPDEGGIVVLRGANGSGKSTAIQAVDALLANDGKPADHLSATVRDQQTVGQVTGFGATITVRKRMTKSGELEVTSLHGRFSIGSLISPGYDTDLTNDKHRIRALLSLSGMQPDPDVFRKRIPGFDEIVDKTVLSEKDVVVMAEKIKALCDKKALADEKVADTKEGQAIGIRRAIDGELLKKPVDRATLDAGMEAALNERSKLKAKHDAVAEATKRYEEAQAAIKEAALENRKTPAELEAFIEKDRDTLIEIDTEMCEFQKKLDEKIQQSNDINQRIAFTENQLAHSRNMEKVLASSVKLVEAGAPTAPSADELQVAENKVTAARDAVGRAELAKDAQAKAAQSDGLLEEAFKLKKKAMTLRDSGASIYEILSEAVGKLGTPLKVVDGRLVLKTARGPATFFSELSDGERAKLAVDIAIGCVDQASVLTLEQGVYEGLDSYTRQSLAAHCRCRNIVIVTAEAALNRDDEGKLIDGITTEVV